MFENSSFQKFVLQIAIVLLIFYTPVFGCDTTPSLIPGNVIDNGDGTFYMDIKHALDQVVQQMGLIYILTMISIIIGTTVTDIKIKSRQYSIGKQK